MDQAQLDLLAKEAANLLMTITSKMTGTNPQIMARGYVVDASAHVGGDMYFSEHKYHFKDNDCTKVLFEIVDDSRGTVWSLSVNDMTKLES